MKFKNYRNSHTNEDTIYSKKNIADMSLREVFARKKEIIAQHDAIGIPSEGELQSSPNAIWVEAYKRDDGTEVRGHWRSKPDGITSNNIFYGSSTGGASEISTNNIDNILTGKMNITNDILLQKLTSEIKNPDKQNSDAIYENLLVNPIDLSKYKKQKELDKKTQKVEFVRPVEGKITSPFGYRPAPKEGASKFHKGIDISVPMNTPVRAIFDGTVTKSGTTNMGGYGVGIFLEHSVNGTTLNSEYGHLSKWVVEPGQKVKQGQIIGYSGNSGISTGPHLHLTIKKYNNDKKQWEAVNPQDYVKY